MKNSGKIRKLKRTRPDVSLKTDFSKIDFRFFKAAMFDYDGTLTKSGAFLLSNKIAQRIGKLASRGFPVAVCTGRQLTSFVKRFEITKEFLTKKFGIKTLENIYLLGENGAVGYQFDAKKNKYKMFYKAKWPREIPKEKFQKDLEKVLNGKAEILDHSVPIVLRPANGLNLSFKLLNKRSAELYKIISKFIKGYCVREYRTTKEHVGGGKIYKALDYLHYGNSGLGCLICPALGDKDTAIKVFYKFLKDKRGIKFTGDSECLNGCSIGCYNYYSNGQSDCRNDSHFMEIMVVGDNPQKSGNDYYFLNGRYGTPFTVGETVISGKNSPRASAKNSFPIAIFDRRGKQLLNEDGTLYLLDRLVRLKISSLR